MPRIHLLKPGAFELACGVPVNAVVFAYRNPDMVTCLSCKTTEVWRREHALIHGPAKTTDGTSDDELRKLWRDAGGNFHGPIVETGTMPEAKLLPFLRSLITRAST